MIIIPRSILTRSVDVWQGSSCGSHFLFESLDWGLQPCKAISLCVGNR